MRNRFSLSTVLVLSLLILAEPSGAAQPTRIVLIGHEPDHPYRTHCYLPDCELLAKCLRQTEGIEATVLRGWPSDTAILDEADAVVLHVRMGGDLLFHPAHRGHAKKLLDRGIGLTALHWSTGASMGEVGTRYLEALGGWFNTDFSRYLVEKSILRPSQKDHPIGRGWKDFELRDEYYIQLRFQPTAQPVMVALVAGEDYPIGWAYERPTGGRSFGFVAGHFHDNFGLAPFRQGVVNGILWTARREIPAEGAPCEIEPADLELSAEFEQLNPAN